MALITLISGPVVALAQPPTAVPTADPDYGVLGAVVTLNGTQSSDPNDLPLTYVWSFVATPIGSQVAAEGFRSLETDSSIVSFSPDMVGNYVLGLQVSNGTFTSPVVAVQVSTRAILVPHARGIIPDGKFIWQYIRDVWTHVQGHEIFETFFSALIQIIGGELLKVYQIDFNKSIRDIQDQFQRRWLKYEPRLDLDTGDLTFYLGDTAAGTSASSIPIGLDGLGIIISPTEFLIVDGSVIPDTAGDDLFITFDTKTQSNVGDYVLRGPNADKTGYLLNTSVGPSFTPTDRVASALPWLFPFGGTLWTLGTVSRRIDYALAMSETPQPSDYLVGATDSGAVFTAQYRAGDVIYFPAGPNKGVYKILQVSGGYVIVDRAPPSFSDATTVLTFTADVYRPDGYHLNHAVSPTTDSFSVPIDSSLDSLATGRIVTFGLQAYEILRVTDSPDQLNPVTVFTTNDGVIISNLNGQTWRVPNTLTSSTQNFQQLGVSAGDLLLVDVVNQATNQVCTVSCQVVGVVGNSLGFVVTDQPLTPGVLPPITNATFQALSSTFGITTVTQNLNGSLSFSGDFASDLAVLNGLLFANTYFNIPLNIASPFNVNGDIFVLVPRTIIRNRLIPVDETVLSIPGLQEWIVAPTLQEVNGQLFQVQGDELFPLKRQPQLLIENNDYIIDSEVAFEGELSFTTGTDVLHVDTGAFLDLGLGPGDSFIIQHPVTLAGMYPIAAVLSQTELQLSLPIPLYVGGQVATGVVQLVRQNTGTFIRIIPGAYSPANPAPDRFWAEVTFFNNWGNVENNFGIMVGLKQADLESISADLNYRQAVAGLMYAYTQGSSINRLKLGAEIFLGLPFAEQAGVILEIDNDYRLDNTGNPIEGRFVIEDVDSTGTPTGTQRIYTFPIDTQSTLSGVDTNPDTGKPYVVGDSVAQFASLALGVEIDDYITSPLTGTGFSAIQVLQQYHSVRIRANDTIFQLSELGLLSSFLRQITPSYVAFTIIEDSEFFDTETVTDTIAMGLIPHPIVDQASFGIPTPMMLDFLSDGVNPLFGALQGYKRVSGVDGATAQGTATLTSASANLLTPQAGEGPVTRAGDKLVLLGGIDVGTYTVATVPTNSSVTVSDGPTMGFQASTGLRFAIIRAINPLLRSDTASVVASNPVITLSTSGLLVDMVAPNDVIVALDGSGVGHKFRIISVSASSGDAFNQVTVTPTPNFTDASAAVSIFREVFLPNPFTAYPLTLTVTGGICTLNNRTIQALLDPGDFLVKQSGDLFEFTVLDPVNLVLTPTPANGTYSVYLAKKRFKSSTPLGRDSRFFDPDDRLDVALLGATPQCTCTATSASVAFTVNVQNLNVKPGDLFQSISGPNSAVDLGYGPGVYPVLSIPDSSHVVLTVPLTQSGSPTTWKLIRRR